VVGVAGAGGLIVGNTVRASGKATIKVGLPGQEVLPSFTLGTALAPTNVDEMLGIVDGAVDGTAGPFAINTLLKIRAYGPVYGTAGVPAAVGDTVYVSDAGLLALVPGTATKPAGSVMAFSGGTFDTWFNGGLAAPTALSSAAPVNVTKAAAAAGASANVSRDDHKHDVTTAAAVAVSTATASAEGAAASLARSDHTHAVSIPVTSDFSVPSATAAGVTDAIIAGVTPGAGTYLVIHQGEISVTNANTDIEFSIFANGLLVSGSRRRIGFDDTSVPNVLFYYSAIVTVAAAQTVEGRWSRTAGTGTMQINQTNNGRLTLIKLA
jgi:hypothetical protein